MLQIRAFRQPYRSTGLSIFIEDVSPDNVSVAEPIILKQLPKEALWKEGVVEPSLILPQETAQKLIDDLWDCGLRPSEGTGSAGALAATQKHLDDMRKIVFAQPYQDLIIKLCNKMVESKISIIPTTSKTE